MKRAIFYCAMVLTLLSSLFFLVACHKAAPKVTASEPHPHPLTSSQHGLVSTIRSSGAWVVKQGDVLQIGMPTDVFFRVGTTNLKPKKKEAVSCIAILVKSYASFYHPPQIIVTGYTDKVFSRRTRKALSLAYAREVTAYLWNESVPYRWISVRGYGAKAPIASNQSVKGSAYNRRVVISIR